MYKIYKDTDNTLKFTCIAAPNNRNVVVREDVVFPKRPRHNCDFRVDEWQSIFKDDIDVIVNTFYEKIMACHIPNIRLKINKKTLEKEIIHYLYISSYNKNKKYLDIIP